MDETGRPVDAGAAGERFEVDAGAAGERLDAFLAARLACSRAEARRALARCEVRVDGRRRGPRAKGEALVAGAVVTVRGWRPPEERLPEPQAELALTVVAEGEGWIAVAKPAGQAVHPFHAGEQGTVLNAAIARYPRLAGVGEGGLRSGVVHRLDVFTSGVLALASGAGAFARLRAAFREGRMEKVYRAVVRGALAGEGRLAVGMEVVRHRPARVAVTSGGRPVELTWRALEPLRGATLVEVRPRTGFLHQIRAAMAHLGHPLLGDTAYGGPGPDASPGAARQLLHARSLRGAGIVAEAPDAADFAEALARLRA